MSRFECTDPNQDGDRIALAISELLTGVGEDGDREGLAETPARAAKAWLHYTSGYAKDPMALLKSFEERDYSEMVIVRGINLVSHCEHHMAMIWGTATVAYIPNGRVVGLSKLGRLVDVFARRLQVQERMTVQIADALHNSPLRPKGVGVMLRCQHACMMARGIQQPDTATVTTALRGVIAQGEPRAEFLAECSRG